MGFKRYDGTPIEIPTHKHSIEDTQIGEFTAYASYTNDGFMQKEDRIKLTSLKTKMDYLNDRLYNAVYFNEPKSSTLVTGEDFYPKLKEVGPNATSVVFTKTAIPSNKISSAIIVSTEDSDVNAYMYLDGNTIYVSPEEDNAIIYANEDCSYMFAGCSSLTSLDFSNFDTSKVTNMDSMFIYCSSLTSLDLSNFDTSNVTSMSYMFYYCSSLTSLDVSNWNTSNVTNMSQMFVGCNLLTSLDVSNFVTSNVTDMGYMFAGCDSLTSLDVSNFNTSKVTNMSDMFSGCSALSGSITIMNSNITDYSRMFSGCSTNSNSLFTVNYKSGCQTVAQNMVNTKSSKSNVVLGTQV